MAVGMLLQAIGLGWFALAATTTTHYAQLVVPLIIGGIGVSMVLPTAATAVVSSVAMADIGKASGVNSTMQRFGSVFGIAVVGAEFAAYGHIGTPATYLAGFRPALGVAAGLSFLGAVTALAVSSRQRESADQPAPAGAANAASRTAPTA